MTERTRRFTLALALGCALLAPPAAYAQSAGDKAKDATDATVHTTKKAGHAVADKTEDTADATVKGTKKVGHAVGDKAEDTTHSTGNFFKRVGHKIKKIFS
jgi:hypothetical protein